MSGEHVVVRREGGIGFFGLLTLVFVVAKIGGWIDWSWWWVFSPLLISVAIACALLVGVLAVAAIATLLEERGRRRRAVRR